jgi:cation:H+ antiporter
LSIPLSILAVAAGFAGLGVGAELLVRGGSRMAGNLGVSPLVIGLTIVAYGTSAPEMVASLVAAVYGHHEITIGNVLGSNIANIGLVLGSTALLVPFEVSFTLVKREAIFMLSVTVLFFALAFGGSFGRVEGVVFLALLLIFNLVSLRWARRAPRKIQKEYQEFEEELTPESRPSIARDMLLILAGCALLFAGGRAVVGAAVYLAGRAGVSETVMGITLVAVGTSLPELVTSVVAIRRNEAAICVGNLVGSNLFNILGAIGVSAAISPFAVKGSLLRFEFPLLLIFTAAMTLILLTRGRVTRGEGIFLLAGYAAFTAAVIAGFSP